MNSTHLKKFKKEMARIADPEKAPQMRAYMKSEMPYLGVSAKPLEALVKEVYGKLEFESFEDWEETIKHLWSTARYREEKYAAILLCRLKNSREFQTPAALPLYFAMAQDGAWWDFVDSIASRSVGPIVRKNLAKTRKIILANAKSDDMWTRRISILCQLGWYEDTDFNLLVKCMEPSIDSKEFFLRKAMGWALREYARTDLKAVVGFLTKYKSRLSDLTVREALKHYPDQLKKIRGSK